MYLKAVNSIQYFLSHGHLVHMKLSHISFDPTGRVESFFSKFPLESKPLIYKASLCFINIFFAIDLWLINSLFHVEHCIWYGTVSQCWILAEKASPYSYKATAWIWKLKSNFGWPSFYLSPYIIAPPTALTCIKKMCNKLPRQWDTYHSCKHWVNFTLSLPEDSWNIQLDKLMNLKQAIQSHIKVGLLEIALLLDECGHRF